MLLYVDFDQLRRGRILNLLNAGKGVEEDEYRKFAEIHLGLAQGPRQRHGGVRPSGKSHAGHGPIRLEPAQGYAKQSGGVLRGRFVCRHGGQRPGPADFVLPDAVRT